MLMSQGPYPEDNYMKTRDLESEVSNPPGREELNETIENRVPMLTFNLQGRQAILPRALCSEPDMIIWAFVGQMISATDTQVLNVSKIRAEGHGYGPTKGILDQDFFSPTPPGLGWDKGPQTFKTKGLLVSHAHAFQKLVQGAGCNAVPVPVFGTYSSFHWACGLLGGLCSKTGISIASILSIL